MPKRLSGPIEYRTFRASPATADDDGSLFGRAIGYNAPTMIGKAPWGFRETVKPGAVTKSINDGDVVLLDNHDAARPLARQSADTLELKDSKNGLDWNAVPADTSYARDVAQNAKAGNYGGCSFGFEVIRDRWTYNADDDVDERELLEVKLHEISVCTFPAYGDGTTSVSARDAVEAGFEARARFYENELRAKYTAAQIEELGKAGKAFKNSDGSYSYPIADVQDLKNAIHAVGRGNADHDAIRKYVIGRAKALGQSSLIPDNWNSDGSLKEANSAPPVTVSGDDYTAMAAALISMYNALPDEDRQKIRAHFGDEERAVEQIDAGCGCCENCKAPKPDETNEADRSEPDTTTRTVGQLRTSLYRRTLTDTSRVVADADSTCNTTRQE